MKVVHITFHLLDSSLFWKIANTSNNGNATVNNSKYYYYSKCIRQHNFYAVLFSNYGGNYRNNSRNN